MDKSYFDVKPKGRHAQVIAKPTADALMEFCRQEPEFEQAIEQSGKTFDDCLNEITNGIDLRSGSIQPRGQVLLPGRGGPFPHDYCPLRR